MAAKRSAPDETTITSKRAKIQTEGGLAIYTAINEKACILCCETKTTFPRVSANCKRSHKNDVCNLCWTKYINAKLFANPSGAATCVQCPAQVSYDHIRKITGLTKYKHYAYLVSCARAEREGKRECLGDYTDNVGNKFACHHFQCHDEEKDGRVFECEKCGNQECVRCDIREHQGETCDVFQARLQTVHGHDEALTAAALLEGYEGKEKVGKAEKEKNMFKLPKPCPACGVLIERGNKCPHMTCLKCGNQFCIRCNAPYFGENSVPQLGNKAHQPDCTYYKREKEDRRFQRRVKKSEGAEEEAGGQEDESKRASIDQSAADASLAKKVVAEAA
ncbi:hypothetical protein LTR65_003052 [Meristemomyces frigidus]